jgi:putative transposase
MPEHVHLLILPAEGVQVSRILYELKYPVARKAAAWIRHQQTDKHSADEPQVMNFWQAGGGYDRNLRSVGDVHEKLNYLHANPVRRGLVDRPEDWPWSSAKAWMDGTDGLVSLDRNTFPTLT